MMTTTNALRAPVGAGTSFRQQLWMMGQNRGWVVLTASLTGLLVVFTVSLPGEARLELVPLLLVAPLVQFAAVGWVLSVWRLEGSTRRTYHWSLPVHRPSHDLARVAVGAVYLLLACGIMYVLAAVEQMLSGPVGMLAVLSVETWGNLFVGPLIAYLLVMPLVQWSESRKVRWALAGFALLGVLAALGASRGLAFLSEAFRTLLFAEQFGLAVALSNGISAAMADTLLGSRDGIVSDAAWWPAAALWFAIGAAATIFTATYRPGDLARRMNR